MSERSIWLYDLVSGTDVGVTVARRWANGSYRTLDTDTPADTEYEDRIVDPGVLRRRLVAGGVNPLRGSTRTEIGVGDFTLDGLDGLLDDVFDASVSSFAERPYTLRRIEPGASFSTAVLVAAGVISRQPRKSRALFTVSTSDRLNALNSAHITATFAGTNALPAGLEGGADMAGRPKYRMYGKVLQWEPSCVNTSRLVWYLSDRALQSITKVMDGGVQLAAGVVRTLAKIDAGTTSTTFTVDTGTDVLTTGAAHGLTTGDAVTATTSGTLPAPLVATSYYFARVLSGTTLSLHPSAADAAANTNKVDITTAGSGTHTLWENATLAGRYDWCFDAAGSYIRLALKPTYRLTVDAVADSAANSTAAQLLKRLATDRGVSVSDISSADVTALDAATAAVLGFVATNETTLALMDEVASTVGVKYGYSQVGLLRMRRFGAPTGNPVLSIDGVVDGTLEEVESDEDVPTTDVRLEYARYYTPLSGSDIATSVSAADASDLAKEYRVAQYAAAISPNPHARTQILEKRTLFTAKADADAEALRLWSIGSVSRSTCVVHGYDLDDAAAAVLDIGVEVGLRGDRFGLDPDTDTPAIVLGIDYRLQDGTCDITCWR